MGRKRKMPTSGESLEDFQWPVAVDGYKLILTETMPLGQPGKEGGFITTGVPSEVPYTAKRYSPLRMFPALFKTFAALEANKDSVLGFVNSYGVLGGTAAQMICLPDPAKSGAHVSGYGEEFSTWVYEIGDMREAVTLWEAVSYSDLATLRQLIHWENGGVYFKSDRCHSAIATPDHPERLMRVQDRPLIDPALYHLQTMANRKLRKDSASARLLWDAQEHLLKVRLVPSSLLGCLWLQLANAIAGGKEFRQCPECRTWFDASPHAARNDKKFCTPSCKAAAHRRNKNSEEPQRRS